VLTDVHDENRELLSQRELNLALTAHERFVRSQGGKRAHLMRRKLDGLNLACRVLIDSDFSGCSFVGATLRGSNLQRASLYCGDLRDADLQGANLVRADLRGAAFKGANLSFAVLDGADLRSARMMIMTAEGASSITDHAEDGRVDFSNCSLKNVSFGNAKLDDADFSGAILEGAKFNGAKLANAKFHGAILTGVNLKDLGAPPEALEGCVLDVSPNALERCNALKGAIAAHEQWVAGQGGKGAQAVLDKEDLRPLKEYLAGRRLVGLSARGAIAIGVSFAGCRLQAARLDGADLRGADLTGCDLRGASLQGANLSHAKFDKALIGPLKLANGGEMPMNMDGAKAAMSQFADATVEYVLPAFA
jgi:uncharacterized protein YjbI with pentapeptide repeats